MKQRLFILTIFALISHIAPAQSIPLNSHSFLISPDADGTHPYIFPTLQAAAPHLTDGTEANPMSVYFAPSVYWIDDPDDLTVRQPDGYPVPLGMTISCQHLHLTGLGENPSDVVLASNRGQTQGANGNYTMFRFIGDGLKLENLTLGNYCNVDLHYPRNPALDRPKRSDAIVQAQLAFCEGDKIIARNVHFISRLNLAPLWGADRVFFDRCHFECTDDALTSNAVYLNCHFTFYSSKPFYDAPGTGAVILNSHIDVKTRGRQYFTKLGGTLGIIDTHFYHPADSLYIGWMNDAPPSLRCYQSNVWLNGSPYTIGTRTPGATVDITHEPVLGAYRIIAGGDTLYNIQNLLGGDDAWNPGGNPGLQPTGIPTHLQLTPADARIETGRDTLQITASRKRFANYPHPTGKVQWMIPAESTPYIKILCATDSTCTLTGINATAETRPVMLVARTPEGLEAATALTVSPRRAAAPRFSQHPVLSVTSGHIKLSYRLSGMPGDEDCSKINWYRSATPDGMGAILVASNNTDTPLQTYALTAADRGHYIIAQISPRLRNSYPGEPQRFSTAGPVPAIADSRDTLIETDFTTFPLSPQPAIEPGVWTVDAFKPVDTDAFDWGFDPTNSWYYGTGFDAAKDQYGLVQASRGARLLYTPVSAPYTDMEVRLRVSPCKSAGQGFGSATGQYMDIYIKFDTHTQTGYALRIERTPRYSDAVDFRFVKYENGRTRPIGEAVSTTCFRTPCDLTIRVAGGTLTATASTTVALPDESARGLVREVKMETHIEPSVYGGTGVLHTGTVGSNAILLNGLRVTWR